MSSYIVILLGRMKPATAIATCLLLAISAALVHHARAASQATDTAEIWSGEEAYWKYLQAGDIEHFRTLWAEDFVGWPIAEGHPIHKADIRFGSPSNLVSYELHRESVDMHGAVGITFYRATVRRRNADGVESTRTSRLTHTWMKRGDRWLIVGGMSAHEPQPATNQ